MQVMARVRDVMAFLTGGIWRIHSRDLPPRQFFLIRLVRVILASVRGFLTDRCTLHASALTFYSVLSIVPAFAMVFGIAKGFGMDKVLEERVRTALSSQPEVADRIMQFSQSALANTKGGLMAAVGLLILIWTVVSVLSNIERSFNEIWGVKEHRTLVRRVTDYLFLVIICPIFIVFSGAATLLATTKLPAFIHAIAFLGFFSHLVIPLLRVLPFCACWALFTFIYIFMPNTKVNLRSALVAGVVAGTAYQLTQWAYFAFQVGVTRYNAVYGSFAAVPFFLLWLQVTWLIVLYGAELSFAHQNVETYEFEPDCLLASRAFKRLVALRVAQLLAANFDRARPPMTGPQISHELGVPIRLGNEVIFDLVRAGILTEAKIQDSKDFGYQPARSICEMTLAQVTEALDSTGTDKIPLLESGEVRKITASLDAFRQAVRHSPANALLKDI